MINYWILINSARKIHFGIYMKDILSAITLILVRNPTLEISDMLTPEIQTY